MSYELYFDDTKIGTIKYEDSDFPNLFGQITFDEKYLLSKSKVTSRVRKYIKLQAQSCELIDIEHEKNVEEELDKLNSELDTYIDLIETNKWYLVDRDGNKQYILSPIIRSDNEVTWRWNIKT